MYRYYDPSIGRYISADPIGQAGGEPNLYAYVSNDPLNWIDPPGLSKWRPVPGRGGWEVRHDPPHYNGDRYHDHYRKRGKEYSRKVDNETGEQRKHPGGDEDKDVPEDVIERGRNAFCPLDPEPQPNPVSNACLDNPVLCALGTAGAGYATYRLLRMAPSVAIPPLWPTIPINAAVP